MSVKEGIAECIGKRIQSIVVREKGSAPPVSVFLVFDDGTHYELYGLVDSASYVREGGLDRAVAYAEQFTGEITIYGGPSP